jgi:hypothetical protein
MIRWNFEPPSRVSLHFGQDQNLAAYTPFKQGRHFQDIESKAAFASRQHIALSILDIVDLATRHHPFGYTKGLAVFNCASELRRFEL